jgi:hypothetical protein
MKHRLIRYCLLASIVILIARCSEPNQFSKRRDVANLPAIFQQLEKLEITAYRNQDWCKNIAYQRGKFSNNLQSTTCNLFKGQPQTMDPRAEQDFQEIALRLTAIGASIRYLSAKYDGSNHLMEAEFHLDTLCRCSYIYQPGYTLPPNMSSEMEYTAIDPNWYFVWEDWN